MEKPAPEAWASSERSERPAPEAWASSSDAYPSSRPSLRPWERSERPAFFEWLDHVARRTGALVNFEDLAGYTYRIPQLALRANQVVHDGPYCRFAKNHGGLQACRDNKKRAAQEALRRGGTYEGLCFRGVWDLAHPVFFRGEAVGVFFLGGFSANAKLAPVDGAVFAGPDLPKITGERKAELRMYAQRLEGQLLFLIEWWLDQGNVPGKKKSPAFYVETVRRVIEGRYHEPLSLAETASLLKVHPNYLGNILLKETGKNFRELLMEERMRQAKTLLSTSEFSITEIAAECGFADRNYFSAAFRKETGLTPKWFRSK